MGRWLLNLLDDNALPPEWANNFGAQCEQAPLPIKGNERAGLDIVGLDIAEGVVHVGEGDDISFAIENEGCFDQ